MTKVQDIQNKNKDADSNAHMQASTGKTTEDSIPLVTRETNIGKLVADHPDTAEVFMDYGLHCVGCFASVFDTIEMGAQIHNMPEEDIDEMIERINEVLHFNE